MDKEIEHYLKNIQSHINMINLEVDHFKKEGKVLEYNTWEKKVKTFLISFISPIILTLLAVFVLSLNGILINFLTFLCTNLVIGCSTYKVVRKIQKHKLGRLNSNYEECTPTQNYVNIFKNKLKIESYLKQKKILESTLNSLQDEPINIDNLENMSLQDIQTKRVRVKKLYKLQAEELKKLKNKSILKCFNDSDNLYYNKTISAMGSLAIIFSSTTFMVCLNSIYGIFSLLPPNLSAAIVSCLGTIGVATTFSYKYDKAKQEAFKTLSKEYKLNHLEDDDEVKSEDLIVKLGNLNKEIEIENLNIQKIKDNKNMKKAKKEDKKEITQNIVKEMVDEHLNNLEEEKGYTRIRKMHR